MQNGDIIMKKVKMLDLLGYQFLSQLQCSPKGGYAAFVVNRQSRVTNGYQSKIQLMDLSSQALIPFPGGEPTEKSFVWDTEDTILCAKRAAGGMGTAYTRRNVVTGEAAPAFTVDYPVLSIWPLISGELYLVKVDVDTNLNPDWTPGQKKDEKDYIRITELPFWDNGIGYVSGHRSTLMLYHEPSQKLTAITAPMFNAAAVSITSDKKQIVYTGQLFDRIKWNKNGLFLYDIASGETKTIIPQDELRLGQLQCCADQLFFTATKADQLGNSDKDDFYLCDLSTLSYHKIADNDFTLRCNVSSDCRYGGGASTGIQDGKLVYLTTEVDVCGLNTLTTQGVCEKLPKLEGAVECLSVQGDRIYFIAMVERKLQEVYCYDAQNGYRQLTHINEAALEGRYIAQPEYAGFVNSDGVRIDGWVLKPIHFDPKKTYPGVLSMHGGPCVAWGQLFVHEMQMLCSEGYFVFYCNPRGSDGRGAQFADLRGKYGSIDFQDFMEFTDHVLEQYPQMDAKHLAAIGGSYGGYMANWMVGHTDRFAAIVSQRSFCNPISDFGVSCIGYSFDSEQFQATPWSDVEKLWDHAPLKYACNAVTPTLFIHSLEDYNCPLTEGFQMFSALKYHGVESEMCLFKGENHELSRSGKPRHRIKRLTEILRWLDGHLKPAAK